MEKRSVWAELNYNEPTSFVVDEPSYKELGNEIVKAKEKNEAYRGAILKSLPSIDSDSPKESERRNTFLSKLSEADEIAKKDPRLVSQHLNQLATDVDYDLNQGIGFKNLNALKQRTESVERVTKANMADSDKTTAILFSDGVYHGQNEDGTRGHYTDKTTNVHKSYNDKSGINEFIHDNQLMENLKKSLGTGVGQHSEEEDRLFLTELRNKNIPESVIGVMQHKTGNSSNISNLEYAAKTLLSNSDIKQGLRAQAKIAAINALKQEYAGLDERTLGQLYKENENVRNQLDSLTNKQYAIAYENMRKNFIWSYADTKLKEDKNFQTLYNPFATSGGKSVSVNPDADLSLLPTSSTNINVAPDPRYEQYTTSPSFEQESKNMNELGVPAQDYFNMIKQTYKGDKERIDNILTGKEIGDKSLITNTILKNIGGYSDSQIKQMSFEDKKKAVKDYYNTLKSNNTVSLPNNKAAEQFTEKIQNRIANVRFKIPEEKGYLTLDQFASKLAEDNDLFKTYIGEQTWLGNSKNKKVDKNKDSIKEYLSEKNNPKFALNGFTGKVDFGKESPNYNYTAQLGSGSIYIDSRDLATEQFMQDFSELQKRRAMPSYRSKSENNPVTMEIAVKNKDNKYVPVKMDFTVRNYNGEPTVYVKNNKTGDYEISPYQFDDLLRRKAQLAYKKQNLDSPFYVVENKVETEQKYPK